MDMYFAQCTGTSEISSLVPHREFLAMVGSEKARATNMNCEVVAVVKHDKSSPLVDITYSKKQLPRLCVCVTRVAAGGQTSRLVTKRPEQKQMDGVLW